MEDAWTTKEAAEFLGMAEQTLANWRWQGYGPPFSKYRGAVRYRPQDVRRWQEEHLRHSTSDRGAA